MPEGEPFHPLAGGVDLDRGELEILFKRCESRLPKIGEVRFIPSLSFFGSR
jgi:Zn-finger nucleic acid-binding protein